MWPLVELGQIIMLPAYDQRMKASHYFNMLDARGVISLPNVRLYRAGAGAGAGVVSLDWSR